MKLIKLEIVGLYGSLNIKIDFHSSINLLVGINGSGKTSVLNCIDWMLRPDIPSLATTAFSRISLSISHEGVGYTLEAVRSGKKLSIREIASSKFDNEIVVRQQRAPENLRDEAEVEAARSYYSRLGPEPHERSLWTFLEDLPHPLTVRLDRSLSAETEAEAYFEADNGGRVSSKSGKTPLDKVIDVTRTRHASFKQQIIHLNDRLKADLVVAAFKSPFKRNNLNKSKNRTIGKGDLERLEGRAVSLLTASLGEGFNLAQVKSYFASAKSFVDDFGSDEKLKDFFLSTYMQIDDFTDAFDRYEKDASKHYEVIGSYLKIVNNFFSDSGKVVNFDESDGVLRFSYPGVSGTHSLERLSSGERQVITLLTFVAFVLERDRVFIVDEPELSLHPKWQENFLDALISRAPVGSQLIVATHSPEIASGRRDSCIVLKPRSVQK